MKSRRLTAALAATAAIAVVGGGTAAATGVFTRADSTERAVRTALDDRHPKNVIFLLGDGMGTQEITAARYYQGVNYVPERGPHAANRLRHHVVAQAGREPALPARLRPRLGVDRHVLGDGPQDDRRAHLAGAEQRHRRPREELPDAARAGAAAGKKVGDVSTAEITDATPAVLASHISLRDCQGPGEHGRLRVREEGRRRARLDRRAGGRPQGRRAARRRPRPLRADDHGRQDAGQTVVDSAEGKGFRYVTDADGLDGVGRSRKPVLGLFTPGNMTQEWTGPAATTGKGNAAVACTEGNRPGERAEPGRDDDQGDRAAGEPQGLLPAGRGRLDRQAATTPRTPAGSSARRWRSTRRSAWRSTTSASHPDTLVVVTADHAHTSQIVSEDAEGRRTPDRLLDQPAHQGRPDADADLRDGRVRRTGRRRRWPKSRASSTPARSCRCGARDRARCACSAPTTTPTCSRRWAAEPRPDEGGGPVTAGPPHLIA